MSTAKLNPCPYCNPFDHELEFVEISTRNFESGIAVECMSCGCRSMAADKSDGEEMAVSLWNSMSVSNNARTPTVGTRPQSGYWN